MSSGECGDGSGRCTPYGPWVWNAYRAYNDLLREKLKAKFEAQEGPWMDRLATELVALVDARWEGGRKGDQREEEILTKIDQLLRE